MNPSPSPGGFRAAPFPGTPFHARPTQEGFHLSATALGLSLGLVREAFYLGITPTGLGAYLEAGYRAGVAVSLGLGSQYWDGCVWDPATQTCASYQERAWGLAVDVAYPFPIPTQTGEAYLAPRVYLGYAYTVRTGQGAGERGRFFLYPGVALGINVSLASLSPELRLGLETGFLLNGETGTFFSPFSLGLSYRF
ncbi:MAG: hypothetical protein ABDH20_12755 [Thermus sp.]